MDGNFSQFEKEPDLIDVTSPNILIDVKFMHE